MSELRFVLVDFTHMNRAGCFRLYVWFVSVTQQFNTTTSMGRLTLNVLLSFALFAIIERQSTGIAFAPVDARRHGARDPSIT